jgi:CHAD domain-containing protein
MREYARLQTSILLRRLAFQVNRAATSGHADSIHDLRVAIRRLSRCLRAFSQFFPGREWKKIRRQLRGLMQAAGAVRDRDIALELLAEAGVSRRAAVAMRLEAERRSAGRDLRLEIRRWESNDFSRKWRTRLEL